MLILECALDANRGAHWCTLPGSSSQYNLYIRGYIVYWGYVDWGSIGIREKKKEAIGIVGII